MREHSQVPRWLPVCLLEPGTPRSLSLPPQPSAHGWKALQRYMDGTLCLKTSFVLPKVACFRSHRAAGLSAHSSWPKIQGWLSLHLGCGITGEAKERERRWEWLKDELQGEFLWAGLSLNSAWLLFAWVGESVWLLFLFFPQMKWEIPKARLTTKGVFMVYEQI